jgi:methylmalonyl-CoA mutase N-terminal domain/subunit
MDWKNIGGTLQNDILKEFHSQNEFIYPPKPA